jgi:SAM-dependent methyltransferase
MEYSHGDGGSRDAQLITVHRPGELDRSKEILANVYFVEAAEWDARYAEQPLVWSAGPNACFADVVQGYEPGTALDVACGEGRNALWLAGRGWQVRALDFSAVAIDKGRKRSAAERLDIAWEVADVRSAELGSKAYDLTFVLFLHLPGPENRDVLTRAAASVRPGGHLVVLGHDRDNIEHGVGGPQDPGRLYTTDLLASCAAGLDIARCEQVLRHVEDTGDAIDTLLVAVNP